jgi:hypothetical protein
MHFALNVVQVPRFESKWNFKEQKYVEHSAYLHWLHTIPNSNYYRV